MAYIVHGVTNSQTRLNDFHTFMNLLEKNLIKSRGCQNEKKKRKNQESQPYTSYRRHTLDAKFK